MEEVERARKGMEATAAVRILHNLTETCNKEKTGREQQISLTITADTAR